MSQLQGGGRPVNSKVFARHTSPSHWPLDCSQGRDFRSCRTPPGTTYITSTCVCGSFVDYRVHAYVVHYRRRVPGTLVEQVHDSG